MKTINEAIGERLSRIKLEKQMDMNDMIERAYRKFPELKKIDGDLVDVRASRLICSIEQDDAPVPALKKREEELLAQRKKFLLENNIPEDFDCEQIRCSKCGDTGFIKASDGRRVVCTACMKDAVIETYNESGMRDFSSFTIKSFDLNYYKNGERKRQFEGLRKLLEGKTDKKLMLLNGGIQTGKTYLAVITCKYAALQGLSSYYVKAETLMYLSREELQELKSYDLIVIDDYSAEVTRNNRIANTLHTLLEARLAADRATVIVSASPLEVLVADSDERIAGKLKSAGTL